MRPRLSYINAEDTTGTEKNSKITTLQRISHKEGWSIEEAKDKSVNVQDRTRNQKI